MRGSIILIFLKGVLMGICDLIPGISGGTIAFITGIYEKLINSVKNFNLRLLEDLIKFNKTGLKKDIKKLNLGFLIALILGILTAIMLGSRIINYLLEQHFALTLSFFIGLILASSQIIYKNINKHGSKNLIFGVFGLIIGISLAFLIPLDTEPSLGYVFFGGFIGTSGMFLPGISGAFILLVLGLYEPIIHAVNNITANYVMLIIFLLGAVLGVIFISRIISYLFKSHRDKTLYLLLGLVIGALSVPIRRILETPLSTKEVLWMIVLLLAGIIIISFINKKSKEVFTGS